MRALRLLRLGIVMSAIGGVALIFAALTGRVAVPIGVIGAGVLFLLVIPLLSFFRLTIGLRIANEKRTSGSHAQNDPPETRKVGQSPS
jgi:hypothetical protein